MSPIDKRRVFDRVVEACARAGGITQRDLGRCRESVVTRPRQVAMWLTREITGSTVVWVAGMFDRDHTTVLHACRVVSADIEERGKAYLIASLAVALMQQRRPLPRLDPQPHV